MKLLVKDIIQETNDAITLCFKNGGFFKKLKYKPGQFLTIHVPINNSIHKRAYSFSSNPYLDQDLKITIKRVDKGLVSNYIHDYLKVGDKLEVDTPTGSFHIVPEKVASKQYVLFAGGSGITPIYSIVESVLSQEPNSRIMLVYANQKIESIIFYDKIKALESKYPNNFSVAHIISYLETEKENMYSGLATTELINIIFEQKNLEYDNHVYMICGPFGYMEQIKSILSSNGITRDKIQIEVFKSPEVKLIGKDLNSSVTLKLEGNTHQFNIKGNTSILQQAMSENIPLPYSCRSGMCSTCKAKCVSGDIKMTDGHLLSDEEVTNGDILTCVSYATSKEVVIEF